MTIEIAGGAPYGATNITRMMAASAQRRRTCGVRYQRRTIAKNRQ
jgi:hypothetical protein